MFGWAVLMAVNLTKLSWVGRVLCSAAQGREAACVKPGDHGERETGIWSPCMDCRVCTCVRLDV